MVIGSPIANRRSAELEGLIGFFVNTLALRIEAKGRATFREVLSGVKERTLGAFEHQDVPFEKLVSELGVARDTSVTPIFQVMFALQNAPATALDVGGLRLSPLERRDRSPRGSTSSCRSRPSADGGYEGALVYDAALFERESAERMARRFEHVLREALADPDARTSDLALMDAVERAHVVRGLNDTGHEVRAPSTLHGWFEAAVDARGSAPALTAEGVTLSYAELDARANDVAWRLVAEGVEIGEAVGLYAERSAQLVVGLLGIVKAGGAYVPLDPSLPLERLQLPMREGGGAPRGRGER